MSEQETKAPAAPAAKRLAEFGQFGELANVKKIDDVLGLELTITGYFLVKGQQGPYAFIQAVSPEGEQLNLMCGGTFVMDALQKVKESSGFPVLASFYKKGKAILVR